MKTADIWNGTFDMLTLDIHRNDLIEGIDEEDVMPTYKYDVNFLDKYIENMQKRHYDFRDKFSAEVSKLCENEKINIYDYDVYFVDIDLEDYIYISDLDSLRHQIRRSYEDAYIEYLSMYSLPIFSVVEKQSVLMLFDTDGFYSTEIYVDEQKYPFISKMLKEFHNSMI